MDRELPKILLTKKKKRKLVRNGLLLLILPTILLGISMASKPKIKQSDILTATCQKGNMDATINAAGIVIPEFEETKTSPISSSISQIFRNTGDKVSPGDTILSLQKSQTVLNLEKMTDELHLKMIQLTQLHLDMQKELNELKIKFEIKKLQVENSENELKEEEYLDKIGGSTKEKIHKASLNLKISKLELEQLEQSVKNLEQSMEAKARADNYEIAITQKNLKELQNKLEHATIIAEKNGVITWINDQLGKNINEGDELVKIADLKSYYVQANISDINAEKLQSGQSVIVGVNENNKLRGNIMTISPSVVNNSINFKVRLDEKSNACLRPNLKVDVFVISSSIKNTLLLKNGAFYKGAAKQFVFKSIKDKLIRQEIETGETNFNYVEIIKGLNVGDKVVISDMSEYERFKEINITNN